MAVQNGIYSKSKYSCREEPRRCVGKNYKFVQPLIFLRKNNLMF